MQTLQLITGDRNFSASSLRAWMLLNEFSVSYRETVLKLFQPGSIEKIALYSPSLQLPVLIHDDIRVWDSLAICEYVNDTFLEGRGWPSQQKKKAIARSISNELHSDFQHLKKDWPMNCQLHRKLRSVGRLEEEIARLDAILYCCRTKHGDGGPYLFGRFSIADCMMAPFAVALEHYGAELSHKAAEYLAFLLDNPHLQWWQEQAQTEIEQQLWERSA